ncbi:MAG: molybdopterin-guanine dinucleotide biosynthesis protein MobB [Clostridia bacterium]
MKVFRICGEDNSGKTTTLEYVVRELTYRGFNVASAKDFTDKNFCVDQQGKNTLRHRIAGSKVVVARGLNETGILLQHRLTVCEFLEKLDYDFCVLEGFDNINLPKIVTARNYDEADKYIDKYTFALSGVAANAANITDYRGVLVYNGILAAKKLTDKIIEVVQDYNPNEPSLKDDIANKPTIEQKKRTIKRN